MNAVFTVAETRFRDVTPTEIAHYREFGWVKLKGFVPAPSVDALLAIAKEDMGEDGDRNAPPQAFSYFNPLTMRGLGHPVLGPVIKHCGHNARALMARKAPVGIRYFTDFFGAKLPSKKPSQHGGYAPLMSVLSRRNLVSMTLKGSIDRRPGEAQFTLYIFTRETRGRHEGA
jgi:hypothetical protein